METRCLTFWFYGQSWSGEDSQAFKAAHWGKPQGLCRPSSDKLSFFLDWGKSLQVPGTGGQCHPKLFRLPGKSISNYKTQVLSSTPHCEFSVGSTLWSWQHRLSSRFLESARARLKHWCFSCRNLALATALFGRSSSTVSWLWWQLMADTLSFGMY